ncbi:MAG: IclR family transcriptional regulator [Firmicutes bacterium]|nr:IclR family transcriptional regulator [Bacillota bacterium]
MGNETESVKSVTKALKILKLFSIENPELGITTISKKLNVSKSTAHRLVTSLQNEGFLLQDKATQQYRLGFIMLQLSEIVLNKMDIREIALPYLQKLRNETEETVSLSIIHNNSRVCIEKAESFNDLRRFIKVGSFLPLYAGASGKMLLAHQDEDAIIKILKEIKPLTDKTIVNSEKLITDLKRIKEQGYCISNGERIKGATGISAPVWNYKGQVIANISISGPSFRFTKQNIDKFLKSLLKTTQEVSELLGYKKDSAP